MMQPQAPIPAQAPSPMPIQTPTPKQHAGARNFFLYFLMFVLLYNVAIAIGGVLFAIINKSLPQVGQYSYSISRYDYFLRYHLSSLIISSPIFFWLAAKVHRESQRDEVMNQSAIRRWLTYITLILAALTTVGDLIGLVYNFLGGETTTRFILKSLVILFISGTVLSYYLNDVKRLRAQQAGAQQSTSQIPRICFFGTIMIVIAAIVSGLFFITSPKQKRMQNEDTVRTSNLSAIQSAVEGYVQLNKKLPASLNDLQARNDVKQDPVTKQPYEYKTTGTETYQLCATFATSNKDGASDEGYYGYDYYGPVSWLHDKGRVCFDRRTVITKAGQAPQIDFPTNFVD